jgi:hypothetical protein
MRMKLHHKGRRFRLSIGALAVLCVVTVPGLAFATSVTGTVARTEYFQNNWGGGAYYPTLLLQVAGANYYAQGPASGCTPANDIDTVKLWVSLAQAAQLSGKQITLSYVNCNSTNYILDIAMLN